MAGLAALVSAGLLAELPGDGAEDTRVAVSGVQGSSSAGRSALAAAPPVHSALAATTTTLAATTTTTPNSTPVAAGPAAVSPALRTPATGTATTTTTVAKVVCRNSHDPACGRFRFEPAPGADQPMTLSVTVEPAVVTAGTPVVLRAALRDPDGVSYNAWTVDLGDGGKLAGSGVATCDRYGPWDPPARDPAAAETVREFTHVFAAPGTYTVRLSFDAGPFDCIDADSGRGERPYASSAAEELTIVVTS